MRNEANTRLLVSVARCSQTTYRPILLQICSVSAGRSCREKFAFFLVLGNFVSTENTLRKRQHANRPTTRYKHAKIQIGRVVVLLAQAQVCFRTDQAFQLGKCSLLTQGIMRPCCNIAFHSLCVHVLKYVYCPKGVGRRLHSGKYCAQAA